MAAGRGWHAVTSDSRTYRDPAWPLLDEDVVRFATARALIVGVDPAEFRVSGRIRNFLVRGSDRPVLACHVTGDRIELIDF